MTTGSPVTGVAEIVLSVRDLPQMRRFYRDVLGFELLTEACHEHGPEPDPTLNHLAIEIPPDRYDSARQRLTTLGLKPETTRFPSMSARALFFKDPEDNLLEFICHDASQG